ncbi:TetR/AcrR family transcriptional regulator [Fibrobacter sp. UWB12]|uniref:TetR/AcrR family transcriptional regulator n=1 Tax=Fibrobacter sp. UWB12 TaxID=1896203 RepID=UPI00091154D0|nr:TetR/AcrR family transcriptional regulator [Fibrobacter sp. UWB12]SHK50555.1 transcriptional regulator, TetR family [Fibrobacter sp. UWB12]
MSTKEKILETALTMFAKNGYNGTSMEQIAQDVGIKAPSLYKHFKGKEDILNSLIDIAEARYEENFGSDKKIGKLPESIDEFLRSTTERIRFTINDPIIRKMRIFLVQEQFRSERLAEITTRHQMDGIQKMYQKIIGNLMNKGLFQKDNPALLAMELIAPVTVLVSKVDRQPNSKKDALKLIEKHVKHFVEIYKK